jgi:hypothetical protein
MFIFFGVGIVFDLWRKINFGSNIEENDNSKWVTLLFRQRSYE